MERRLLITILILLVFASEVGSWRTLRPSPLVGKDHWVGTGISWKDLYPSFSDRACNIDSRSQLSCLVGLEYMARQVSLRLRLGKNITLAKLPLNAEVRPPRDQQVAWENQLMMNPRTVGFSVALERLKSLVQNNPRESAIVASGLNGQLSVRFDPHTYLIPISQFEENLGDQLTQEIGVGVQLKRINGQVIVSKVFANSRAEVFGVRRGDRVLAIDGALVSARNIERARMSLKGEVGSRVTLRIARGNQDIELRFQREKISINPVESKVITQNGKPYGVLLLSKFSSGSCIASRLAVIGLLESGVKGVILDLRENGGGQLDEAGCIAELFLPKESVVYSTEYFDGLRQERYLTRLAPTYSGPLAVLINANTASAAEILAGSLQDHSRALVVGERSFGKGSFQAGRVWEQNSKVAFFKTQGLYYLPSGRSTQNVGVSPDIEVVGPGPQAQREADLYSNTIATQLSTRTVLTSLIAGSCSSVEQEAIIGAFAADRQLGKAYRALDCLRGVYGTTAD